MGQKITGTGGLSGLLRWMAVLAVLTSVYVYIDTTHAAETGIVKEHTTGIVKEHTGQPAMDAPVENPPLPSPIPPPAPAAPAPIPAIDTPKSQEKKLVTHVGHTKYLDRFALLDLQNIYLNEASDNDGDAIIVKNREYPNVRRLPHSERLRILVTGGAGFVGSHLVDRLMLMGHEVIVLDNFFTGRKRNIQHWIGHPHFELVRHDVVDPYMIEVDRIYHLACPASPPHYQYNPIKTVKTSVMGSINMLGLAKRVKARFLLTSTSEVYGDPLEHPQLESYWGNVNPIGPRACYDEGKRVAETLTYSYAKQDRVAVRVARIFNTFGPRMNENDGRVVSNFILQALRGDNITVYGDGMQTRSFQYVHDLVDGLIALMEGNFTEPINLGNPDEYTILHFAETIRDIVNPKAAIIHMPATEDDPQRRRPDITRARGQLGWQPRFSVKQGVEETVKYFQALLEAGLI